MKKIAILLIALMSISIFQVKAQHRNQSTQPIPLPSWVYMIDNPELNYYEAVKAFDNYWQGKVRPEGEEEIAAENETEKQARKEFEKTLATMTPQQKQEYELLRYHYKRFENWEKEMKPFVQEDGRILSMEERMAIWYKQQNEIKQQNK